MAKGEGYKRALVHVAIPVVGEEGLDIGEVDFIVSFDNPKANARSGEAKAQDGASCGSRYRMRLRCFCKRIRSHLLRST